MRYRLLLIAVISFVLQNPISAQVGNILKKAKSAVGIATGDENERSAALKEALNLGVEAAVNQLSVDKGYLESPYKILIPEDAKNVINKVKMIPGFQDVETKLTSQMNKAAEIAAKKATPVFVNAIKQMTVQDAASIIAGKQDAATMYLSSTSRAPLYNEFMPIIQAALDEVNARTYWKTVIDAYNKIPLVRKMNPALDDHVNNKALDGLFGLIAVKEAGIRNDINQRTSDLLRKVFGK